MRTQMYESAVLINAALDDEQIEATISKIKDAITNNGGEIRDIENWGRKRLAYMVKKSKIGYYVIFRFEAPVDIVTRLEKLFTLDENILRYLTISLSEDALEHIEKNRKEETSTEEEKSTPASEDKKEKNESEEEENQSVKETDKENN